MREPDPKEMIVWLQHMIDETERSIAYYKMHPEKDKSGFLVRNYEDGLPMLRERVALWESKL